MGTVNLVFDPFDAAVVATAGDCGDIDTFNAVVAATAGGCVDLSVVYHSILKQSRPLQHLSVQLMPLRYSLIRLMPLRYLLAQLIDAIAVCRCN